MADTPIIELIDPDLQELMERFFINSNEDLEEMKTSLASSDFETLARLGHTAKGTGFGYGFKGMGEIGADLEVAAKGGEKDECARQVERMAHYLANVKVEFGE